MARFRWDLALEYRELVLEPDMVDRPCAYCGVFTYIYAHRDRRLSLFGGPMHLVSKLAHCADLNCPGHMEVVQSAEEMGIAPPYWTIGWDIFAWMGHRRFARHWSVPQIRAELNDSYHIAMSPDSIEKYLKRYQVMVADRETSPERLAELYRQVEDVVLTVDGLQPEKGHETLYVVRELRLQHIWFAVPLLSSSTEELKKQVFDRAATWVERLGKPVRLWISDKQKAFVTCIASVFPGVSHRYCQNHFLRDLAKPVLEKDSHAKVQMRRKVRGLRAIERRITDERRASPGSTEASHDLVPPPATDTTSPPAAATSAVPGAASTVPDASRGQAQEVVLEYAAAIRGILNDDQGGPLDPPGLRMAEALGEVRDSIQRCVGSKKGGLVITS
jgi:hypothetical protein